MERVDLANAPATYRVDVDELISRVEQEGYEIADNKQKARKNPFIQIFGRGYLLATITPGEEGSCDVEYHSNSPKGVNHQTLDKLARFFTRNFKKISGFEPSSFRILIRHASKSRRRQGTRRRERV